LEAIARGELPPVEPEPPEPEPRAATPAGAQDAKYDLIALEFATGTRTTQLATQFGYTYGGMYQLLNTPAMVERVQATRAELMDRAVAATARILYRLDRLVDHELALADPSPTTEADPGPTPGLHFYDKKSIDARRYLIDKVVAQKQQVTSLVKTENSDESTAALVAVADTLKVLREVAAKRIPNIHASPHIFDGKAATARAIDVEVKRDGE
jgi:hypothetical protein